MDQLFARRVQNRTRAVYLTCAYLHHHLHLPFNTALYIIVTPSISTAYQDFYLGCVSLLWKTSNETNLGLEGDLNHCFSYVKSLLIHLESGVHLVPQNCSCCWYVHSAQVQT